MIGKDNAIHSKSKSFAVRIVKMAAHLQKEESYVFYPIFQQVLKSGTSIGANIRESQYAESTEDFVHKLRIALKEANETDYWLEILFEGGHISSREYESIVVDCKELIKLLIAIINKTKSNNS